ncbi:carboxylate--amine ligase [Auraticoccus monumenti]|uniref:carboxylate--amine ligase n=1 Tax=Auraticoccus monumenti TaxID=675864 RepID=UPI00155FBC7D|nr:carboxylate--amine ligase [Auraticoccus monumenti]
MSSGQPIPVVVVGLGSVAGLQTARLLAARGVPVVGITSDRNHFGARTRVCREVHEADIHGGGFLQLLDRLRIRPRFGAGAVLVPCTDQAALLVSEHREQLAPTYRTSLAPHETMVMLADKAGFARFTAELGLTTPRTLVLTTRADAEHAAATLRFPLVVKPSIKDARWKAGANEKVRRAPDAAALLSAWEELSPWSDRLVVQEFVPGGEEELYTCNAYFDARSRPLATYVSRKVRQWPAGVGTASLARSVRDEGLVQLTTQLFGAAGFTGLAYLEVKRDRRDGSWSLIEANVGRPTGRSAMAEAGGVELLMTMYADVLGLPLPGRRLQGDSAVGWIDDRRDLLASLRLARRGELTPRAWVGSVRGPKVHAVASLRDPLPGVLEVTQSSAKYLRRRVPGPAPTPVVVASTAIGRWRSRQEPGDAVSGQLLTPALPEAG